MWTGSKERSLDENCVPVRHFVQDQSSKQFETVVLNNKNNRSLIPLISPAAGHQFLPERNSVLKSNQVQSIQAKKLWTNFKNSLILKHIGYMKSNVGYMHIWHRVWRSFCQNTKSNLSQLLSMLGQFWVYFWILSKYLNVFLFPGQSGQLGRSLLGRVVLKGKQVYRSSI